MNNNTHPEEHVLLAFFDGELAAAEVSMVEEHCESCAECGQTLADFAVVQEMVQANAPLEVPRPVWAAVTHQQESTRKRNLQPALAFGTLAASIAGLALGLYMGEPLSNDTNQSTDAWASADYLWTETASPSLFVVFSEEQSQEGSGES